MTGGSAKRIEWGPMGVPGPNSHTALSPFSNSGVCPTCSASLDGRPPDAVYCGTLCRERASRARRDERERLICERLTAPRLCKTCVEPIAKGQQYCAACRRQRRDASKAASEARHKAAMALLPPKPPKQKRIVSRLQVETWPVAPGTTGAICELLVAADLLRRGYHVFRAVSPNCPCDLLVMRDGLSARVEVRKAQRAKDGGLRNGCEAHERERFDVLARVESDGTVHYNGLEKIGGVA